MTNAEQRFPYLKKLTCKEQKIELEVQASSEVAARYTQLAQS